LFLFLALPLPESILHRAVVALQKGSADVAHVLFRLAGAPVFKDGFRFSLPGVEVEIAEECSGIRSSISLLICGILASHFLLQSNWRRLFLVLFIVPVVILKNAVRIFTITWLGVYVDRDFLYGNLHRYGGLPFSVLAVAILGCAIYLLQQSQRPSNRESTQLLNGSLR